MLAFVTAVEEEARAKFPEETGMLVVSEVVKDGASHNLLNPGDVVRTCNPPIVVAALPPARMADARL